MVSSWSEIDAFALGGCGVARNVDYDLAKMKHFAVLLRFGIALELFLDAQHGAAGSVG